MKSIRKSDLLSTRIAAGDLDSLIDRLQADPLPVIFRNKNGNQAALISMEDFDLLRDTLATVDEIDDSLPELSAQPATDRSLFTGPVPVSDDYAEVFQFKIFLSDVTPEIWRRIQVPVNYTFWDLHVAIQDAMGWEDAHMHSFEIVHPDSGRRETIGTPFDNFDENAGPRPDWEARLADHFSFKNTGAAYIYDFGDNWVHRVQMEDIKPRDDATEYPICLDGRRACPPEDCGGIPGYEQLLEVVDHPDDEDDEYWSEWIGEGFDPEYFSPTEVLFDDPEERWEDTFGAGAEDEDEDWLDDDALGQLRQLSRERMHRLWQCVQNDDLADLSPEELRITQIMQEHEDTFFNQFSVADLTADHIFDPETEVDPFLHITLHAIVEKQIEDRNPVEVFQFYNAMRNKKCARHEALHLLGLILTQLLYRVFKFQEPFDLPLYTVLLKKYKNRNPDKIPNLLENDPELG